jgi:hypothetical protein
MKGNTYAGGIRQVLAAMALTVAIGVTLSAQAQNLIPPSEDQGEIPGFGGTGLAGLYYDNGNNFSFAAGSQAEASFTANNLCFPDCLGNSFTDSAGGLQLFTNGSASNFNFFTSVEPVRLTWDNSEIVMAGYIAITTPGTYTFTVGSDDNTFLTIGGVQQQILGGGPQTFQDTFTQAGLYKISVDFLEINGASRLSFVADDPNGNCIIGCYNVDNNLNPNDLFYSDADLSGAPAPTIGGGWAAITVAGLMGIEMMRRRSAVRRV